MTRQPPDPLAFDEERIGGYTIEDLSDYLDRGRTPRNPAIEDSPECRLALSAIERLRSASRSLIETDAANTPAPSESWFTSIICHISREVRADRDQESR